MGLRIVYKHHAEVPLLRPASDLGLEGLHSGLMSWRITTGGSLGLTRGTMENSKFIEVNDKAFRGFQLRSMPRLVSKLLVHRICTLVWDSGKGRILLYKSSMRSIHIFV